jgi:hypothetical protein
MPEPVIIGEFEGYILGGHLKIHPFPFLLTPCRQSVFGHLGFHGDALVSQAPSPNDKEEAKEHDQI